MLNICPWFGVRYLYPTETYKKTTKTNHHIEITPISTALIIANAWPNDIKIRQFPPKKTYLTSACRILEMNGHWCKVLNFHSKSHDISPNDSLQFNFPLSSAQLSPIDVKIMVAQVKFNRTLEMKQPNQPEIFLHKIHGVQHASDFVFIFTFFVVFVQCITFAGLFLNVIQYYGLQYCVLELPHTKANLQQRNKVSRKNNCCYFCCCLFFDLFELSSASAHDLYRDAICLGKTKPDRKRSNGGLSSHKKKTVVVIVVFVLLVSHSSAPTKCYERNSNWTIQQLCSELWIA